MKRIKFMEYIPHKLTGDKNVTFEKGEVVDINDASANHWVSRGRAVYVDDDYKAPEDEDSDPATLEEIVAAIQLLDNADGELWTGQGKPQVNAIFDVLGKDVSAKERDEAWDSLQA